MAQEGSSGGIEEIVVTAQKRAENLQKVPLSITAFSEEAMENRQLVTIADIARSTPNFTYTAFGGNRPEFTIRGIGTSGVVRASLDNAVVVFVDEFYVSRSSASTFNFFDLEQVAVLRGPQGTSFRKNVESGADLVTTSKPNTDSLEASIRGGACHERLLEFKGLIPDPISDAVVGKSLVAIAMAIERWRSLALPIQMALLRHHAGTY